MALRAEQLLHAAGDGDRAVLAEFAAESLGEADRALLVEHLHGCGECRGILALITPEEGPPAPAAVKPRKRT